MIRLINSMRSISAGPIMEIRSQIEPVFENWPCCGNDGRCLSLLHHMHLTGVIMDVHCSIFFFFCRSEKIIVFEIAEKGLKCATDCKHVEFQKLPPP